LSSPRVDSRRSPPTNRRNENRISLADPRRYRSPSFMNEGSNFRYGRRKRIDANAAASPSARGFAPSATCFPTFSFRHFRSSYFNIIVKPLPPTSHPAHHACNLFYPSCIPPTTLPRPIPLRPLAGLERPVMSHDD
jgi:hypothetical protein